MRKLGLIGCGPESIVPYYLGVVQGVRARVGGGMFAPGMTIECLSRLDATHGADEAYLSELTDRLATGVDRLIAAGCAVAALGCDAGHIVFDELQGRSPIPLVSMVDATREELIRRGVRRPILLGTAAAMRGAYLKVPLVKAGLQVMVPGEGDRAWLGGVIADELEQGVVHDETVERLARLVADGAEHGADAVVAACAGLAPLVDRATLGLPVVDTLQVHVDALVDAMLDE